MVFVIINEGFHRCVNALIARPVTVTGLRISFACALDMTWKVLHDFIISVLLVQRRARKLCFPRSKVQEDVLK